MKVTVKTGSAKILNTFQLESTEVNITVSFRLSHLHSTVRLCVVEGRVHTKEPSLEENHRYSVGLIVNHMVIVHMILITK
jgi:hypothetical protein